MGIERIGSVGTMNIKPATRVEAPEVAVSATPVKVDRVAPVTTQSRSGYSQSGDPDADRAGVQSEKEISPEKVKSAVDDINKQIKSNLRKTHCSFKYHEDTNRISITVTDSDTDEVIREIPPEKALDMLAKAWELAGLMVDEKR
ncbi:MAG: flagellar protein FlaG [Lachnospiraceae bacterium]|nr:flagellar protein FlaG [Lachnospiraceae bacterium]